MRIIAHRGANRAAIENTLRAFEIAREHADGVELDTQLARCGTPVVFHDDTLERHFGLEASVGDLTAEELARLVPRPREDARPSPSWEATQGDRIPTLRQVLDLLGRDFFVNVEIKAPRLALSTPTRAVAQVLREVGPSNVLVSSFNPVELGRFSALSPGVPIGLLFEPESGRPLRHGWSAPVLGSLGLRAIHPNWKLVSVDMIERAHARGWQVNVWTVNDAERARRLMMDGIDGLITDASAEFADLDLRAAVAKHEL